MGLPKIPPPGAAFTSPQTGGGGNRRESGAIGGPDGAGNHSAAAVSACSPPTALLLVRGVDNVHELLGLQSGAADEAAVDIGLATEPGIQNACKPSPIAAAASDAFLQPFLIAIAAPTV